MKIVQVLFFLFFYFFYFLLFYLIGENKSSNKLLIKQKNYLGKFLNSSQLPNKITNLLNTNIKTENENISNAFVINPYTIVNHEINLLKLYNNIIYQLDDPIQINELYISIIYLMQGIPSKFFCFDYNNFSFILRNRSFRLPGSTNDLIANYLKVYY